MDQVNNKNNILKFKTKLPIQTYTVHIHSFANSLVPPKVP